MFIEVLYSCAFKTQSKGKHKPRKKKKKMGRQFSKMCFYIFLLAPISFQDLFVIRVRVIIVIIIVVKLDIWIVFCI